MKVTALRPHPGDPERLDLCLDGRRMGTVSREAARTLGLELGGTLDPERLARIRAEEEPWRAREAALRLLAVRPRSRAELDGRLRRRGIADTVVTACLDRLQEADLLDDRAFAEAFVRDRVRLRPQGRHRLRADLRSRGVSRADAEAAIATVLEAEETDEESLARRAARGWRPRAGEEPLRARRRLRDYLLRRGFPGEAVRRVVAERLADGSEDGRPE